VSLGLTEKYNWEKITQAYKNEMAKLLSKK